MPRNAPTARSAYKRSFTCQTRRQGRAKERRCLPPTKPLRQTADCPFHCALGHLSHQATQVPSSPTGRHSELSESRLFSANFQPRITTPPESLNTNVDGPWYTPARCRPKGRISRFLGESGACRCPASPAFYARHCFVPFQGRTADRSCRWQPSQPLSPPAVRSAPVIERAVAGTGPHGCMTGLGRQLSSDRRSGKIGSGKLAQMEFHTRLQATRPVPIDRGRQMGRSPCPRLGTPPVAPF